MNILRGYFYIKLYSDALQTTVLTCRFEIFIISEIPAVSSFVQVLVVMQMVLCFM
jgi:hypothetical protein